MDVEAVIDTGATAPVVGPKIAKWMGVWKWAKSIRVKQGDGSFMKGGKFVVNLQFFFTVLKHNNQYPIDAEVLDIGYRDMIIGLSWLKKNAFSVDIPNQRLVNNTTGVIIPCNIWYIPTISLMEEHAEILLEEGNILLIFDAANRYSRYVQVFFKEQVARLPKHSQ